MRVAIIGGILEGRLHSKRLRQELTRRGHSATEDLERAEVILAHSAGWVFLPPERADQRVIFIDPAYKTEKSYARRTLSRLRYDILHPRFHMPLERLWNLWYLFRYFSRWVYLARHALHQPIDDYLRRPGSLVIGVRDRTWWHQPTIDRTGVAYTRVAGDHDSLWSETHRFLESAGL